MEDASNLCNVIEFFCQRKVTKIERGRPFALKEKGQYVTITFTTTCNYLVFATKFLLSTTIVTLC
jgi:hypothetical protein